jgi:hypothetical protein
LAERPWGGGTKAKTKAMKKNKNEEMLATLLAEVRALRTQVAELGQVRNQEEGSKLSFDFSKIQKQDVMIRFNFKRIHKKEIYQAFLQIYARGGIELNNQELIAFLARYTNLGSEASIKTLFYRYKQHVHL